MEMYPGTQFLEPVIIRVFKVFFRLWRQTDFKLLFGFTLCFFFSLSVFIHNHSMEEFRRFIDEYFAVFPDSLKR